MTFGWLSREKRIFCPKFEVHGEICSRFADRKIVQEVLAQITWYHNIALMDKVKTAEEHIWYANATAQNAGPVMFLSIRSKVAYISGKFWRIRSRILNAVCHLRRASLQCRL